jgi:hypothetical protein
MSDRIGCLGCALFVALVAYFASKQGGQWEFGRLGMPEPVFDVNGRHPDGTFVDPVNRALVESGHFQEAMWGLALVVVCIWLWVVWLAMATKRSWREYQEVLAKLAAIRRKS